MTTPLRLEVGETAEALLAAAALGGVDNLWFASGSELTSLQEAAARATALGTPAPTIRTTIHEHVGLCLAMGETMVSGRPSMFAAHADLGLLNCGGALHNAARGGYPVLILTGYPPTSVEARTSPVFWKQQRWDQGEIVRQYVKWDHKLAATDDPTVVVARALQVACSAPAGPSYLAMPAEVGRQRIDATCSITTPEVLGVARLGGGAPDAVVEIASALLAAERPLIVTDRVGRDPAAVLLLDELAREFAVGVRATRHRMNIADDHPSARAAYGVSTADTIVVLEQAVPWVPAHEQPPTGADVSVVGADPAAIAPAHDIPLYEFPARRRVQADAAEFLTALLHEMRRQRTAAHRSEIEERWRSFESARSAASAATVRPTDHITPQLLGEEVNAVLEPDDLFCWELADSTAVVRTRPGSLFEKGGSSLGWAVAAATGGRLVDRQRPAVVLTGDGSYLYGIPTALLWSQQTLDAPVLTVVANNRGYRTGTSTLVANYPNGYAARAGTLDGGAIDPPPDIAAQAVAAGGYGSTVRHPSELKSALVEARRAVEHDRRPAVVDVWLPAHVTGAL